MPGGGVALLNASEELLKNKNNILLKALKSPFETILDNAGVKMNMKLKIGEGMNVINGNIVNMVEEGIIDPVLVTKSALKNAVSVALTIMSADCVISNIRMDASN